MPVPRSEQALRSLLIRQHKRRATILQQRGEYGQAEYHALRAEELMREQDANYEVRVTASRVLHEALT